MAGAIAVATVLVFAPSLSCGFVWDDDFNLLGNVHYRGFGGTQLRWMFTSAHMGHYHPLTWLSFALDHRLYGLEPRGYHLTNVLVHAANAGLVYMLVLALLRRHGPAEGEPHGAALAAAVGALLFALHPLRVESVTWVTERRDVLSAFFYLLAVLAYLRAAEPGARRGWLGASLVAAACSLLAKAWGITLPVVLLVLDAYPLRRFGREKWRRLTAEKLPFVLLAAGAAGAAVWAQHAAGAMVSLAEHGPAERVVQALYGVGFYLWKTAVPLGLSPLYPMESFAPRSASVLAVAAAALVVSGLVFASRRRWPGLAAAWCCYLLVLAPVLGLAQSGMQFAADRYSYLAVVPLVALAAGSLQALLRRHPGVLGTMQVVAVVVVVGLALLARRQIPVWHDAVALWTRAVAVYPDSHNAWHNLGLGRLGLGNAPGALADFDRAVALAPDFAPAYNSRGTAREALRDLTGARADFDRAIALLPAWPDPYNNRGNVRLASGDTAGAVSDYDRVLALAPEHTRALFNRALAREREKDVAGARDDLDALLAIVPDYAYGYATRVRYRAALGDLAGALADCEHALALLPAGSADARTVEGYRATLRERLQAR